MEIIQHNLAKAGKHDVRFITAREDAETIPHDNIKLSIYKDVDKKTIACPPSLGTVIETLTRSQIIQQEIIKLAKTGFTPRLVFFHGGNGLGALLRVLLPGTKLIGYFEWYFNRKTSRHLLASETLESLNLIQLRNSCTLLELIAVDTAVTPTLWQKSQFPVELQNKINVIFDGVNKQFFRPPGSRMDGKGVKLRGEDSEIIIQHDELLLTYATRGMEPLRGFPEFMRALPSILAQIPNLKVIIGGRDRSAYGPQAPTHSGSWKLKMLEELGDFPGQDQITFTGLMPYEDYRLMLQRTNLHVYLTRPYVTSWSLFEAAACGTPIITNQSEATTGTLSIPIKYQTKTIEDFNSAETILQIVQLLQSSNPERDDYLDDQYELNRCLQSWEKLINNMIKKKDD